MVTCSDRVTQEQCEILNAMYLIHDPKRFIKNKIFYHLADFIKQEIKIKLI